MAKVQVLIGPAAYPPDKLVGTGAVGHLFGVADSTVNDWCRKGIIPAKRPPRGHWRILWADAVELWDSSGYVRREDEPVRETAAQRKGWGKGTRRKALAS
jgi:hypothetical protein